MTTYAVGSGQGDEEAAWKRAQALDDLFARADNALPRFLPWSRVLWSPQDRHVLPTNPQCPPKHRGTPRTEIQDWFMNLVDARNAVIHEGTLNAPSGAG